MKTMKEASRGRRKKEMRKWLKSQPKEVARVKLSTEKTRDILVNSAPWVQKLKVWVLREKERKEKGERKLQSNPLGAREKKQKKKTNRRKE
jgi:hypothetical protein